MKQYGKYEKRAEAAPAKQPKAKDVLLQTYFTSLLCLVLCVTMFFGTSFAWFTSEVNNNANEIYVGTLKVGLYKVENGQNIDLDGNEDEKLFDGNIRWEPGYTALETIRIENQGDLAFNYVLKFTGTLVEKESAVAAEAETTEPSAEESTETTESENKITLADVAACFDVWVYDHTKNEGKENVNSNPASYADINEKNGWTPVGSLAELLAGEAVLSGTMDDVRSTNNETAAEGETTGSTTGTFDGLKTDATYTIALHMNESADAKVMGQKISLNVMLVAYQMAYEVDDLGNKNYDVLVASESDLREALQNGGQVTLLENIVLTEGMKIPADVTVDLDLNGHTISATTDVPMSMITNDGTLNVNDSVGGGGIAVTFDGKADNSAAVNAINNRGTMTVNGGQISNTNIDEQIGYPIDNYDGATLTVNGGSITATGSYSDGIRLFCGSNETVVTVNGGKISTIWAQNPSNEKAEEVHGTVIVNGGSITTAVYYENYTTVKIAEGVTCTVTPYGNGKDNTTTTTEGNYTVYSFVHSA